jgi:hypothetical protein
MNSTAPRRPFQFSLRRLLIATGFAGLAMFFGHWASFGEPVPNAILGSWAGTAAGAAIGALCGRTWLGASIGFTVTVIGFCLFCGIWMASSDA